MIRKVLVGMIVAGVIAGCGGTTTTGSGAADSFIAACEGDAGSRSEAHCDCIERNAPAAVSQQDLNDIRDGNPPIWYMKAAISC